MKRVLFVLLLVLPTCAEAQVKAKFSFSQLSGVAFNEGHTVRLPVVPAFGIALAIPFDGFAWGVESTLVTPLTEFTPAYRISTGPSFKINSTWSVGASALYQYRPDYEDIPNSSQQIGLAVGPSAQITDGVSVGVGVGGWKVLDEHGPYILALQLCKLSFSLP